MIEEFRVWHNVHWRVVSPAEVLLDRPEGGSVVLRFNQALTAFQGSDWDSKPVTGSRDTGKSSDDSSEHSSFGTAAAQTQAPSEPPNYFGTSDRALGPSSETAAPPAPSPRKPTMVDLGIQRELQQLSDRRQADIAAAVVAVNQQYKTSLQDVLKHVRTVNDTQTASKIEDIMGTLDNLLNHTAWVDRGNYWAHELDFKDNMLTILMRNGGVRQTPYRTRDGMLTFIYDGNPQQITIAPDRSSIGWLGTTFFAK